MLYVIR
ncbi:1a38bfdf-5b48-430a-8cd9-a0bd37843256 [Thermothielavioides terrestris]|nr:1a38bfdf-5b48-430a-8cd9-a0bd37843256 [Thermothielavioides terrestris]